MGWQGGAWLGWLDKQLPPQSRVFLSVNCTGVETELRQCEHLPRQMGGPTCGK